MLFNKLNNWLKSSVRLLLTAFICGLLFISSAYPAQAVTSSATDSEVSLNKVQKETDDVAKSNPRGIKETTKKAQGGLNAVQGGADKDKMVSPEDTNATTVKEKAASFLDNLK
ncbi:MAG: hypothetical protein QNJ53_21150 [Pleurocapsa sp. MO_192.B19]|nr:hypothetical protein [Pleurocapsa sp. MO_192.B19]